MTPRALRVLIADDHEPTRADVRRSLERDGRFSICGEAADAAGAIAAALRHRPDICLLDIRMPGSGLMALREIFARLPATKVVMLTVSEDDRDLLGALRAGALGYLPKSLDLRRLPDALLDVASGGAALPATLAPRVLQELRQPAASRRRLSTDDWRSQLTSREWDVLHAIADGLSDTQVARRLSISPATVRWYVHRIMGKLGFSDRDQLLERFQSSN